MKSTAEPIRVLQVIGAMDRGGAETLVMNLYRNIDRSRIQFDFLVNEKRECDFDSEIKELGGKIYYIPRYKIFNYFHYKAKCREFFCDRKTGERVLRLGSFRLLPSLDFEWQ